jgi:type VI secretion system protein ImpJ
MTKPSKILWSEGVTLRPQQFQQQDRYHEGRLHRITTATHPHLWGVRSIQWNKEGLANGILRADAMSLIFQDGETYDAPDTDVLPTPVDLTALPATEETFTFYAALPLFNGHGGNLTGMEKAGVHARYFQTELETADLYTQALHSRVVYLTKQVELLSHLTPRSSYVNFPVIRLRRIPSGGFDVDPAFVAPSLSISAADPLLRQLDALMQKLRAKIDALYADQREQSKDVIVVQSGDASSFWLLHTISAACTSLTHYANCKAMHPERLFLELLNLAGGLMAFSKKYSTNDIPAYEHGEPGPAFVKLEAIIRDLVDTVISSKYLSILLTQTPGRPSYFEGSLPDAVDHQTLLCLGVRADMPALELVAAVPNRFKIGSPDDVGRMVASALPGVELVHMPQVPSTVPIRPNTYYFSLASKTTLYENMLKSQAVTVYVPSGIRELKVEMFAVMP